MPVWMCPGSVESGLFDCHARLGVCVKHLVLDRGAHPQGAVASWPVAEDLPVFEDRIRQLDAGLPALTVE
jgi:hypothetical protein